MKRFLLTLSTVVVALSTWAVSYYNKVTLHLEDGSTVEFYMSDDVNLTFSETHLNVNGTGSDISVPLDQFVKMSHDFDNEKDGVENIAADVDYEICGDKILFNGLPEGSVINIHTLAGALVLSHPASGEDEISLAELSTGIYIVSVNGTSIKVSIK